MQVGFERQEQLVQKILHLAPVAHVVYTRNWAITVH